MWFALLWLAACRGRCAVACERAYSPDECALQVPGAADWTEPYEDCVHECAAAMGRSGGLGGYDPNERNATGQAIVLENRAQAVAWADCIVERPCEDLAVGFCSPI